MKVPEFIDWNFTRQLSSKMRSADSMIVTEHWENGTKGVATFGRVIRSPAPFNHY